MCGRFTFTVTPDQLAAAFPSITISSETRALLTPRYNIAPSQNIPVVPNDGNLELTFYRWGLIPFWSKDMKIGNKMINARGETVAEKPSFRDAYKKRRCLILADGFYEWMKIKNPETGKETKQPVRLQLESQEPFAFAGLWETWRSPEDEEIRTTTIITTEPNELVAKVHNRMPVILPKDAYDIWLDPKERTREELDPFLTAYPASELMYYPVSKEVNSPGNDNPTLIEPISEISLN